ncbi:MAG: chloride channel protein [Eubacterium sp.]|nr:chloride channel protein [Eubacterium sp.]
MKEQTNKLLKHKADHMKERVATIARAVVSALFMGTVLGGLGAVFYHAITLATEFRLSHWYVVLLLPVGAVLILLLYHVLHDDNDKGTNLVLASIQSDKDVPFRMSLLIFVSTIFSHFVGASVGREGAALQIGGSVGNYMGRFFSLSKEEKKTLTMIGMSAMFSALFGTPMAAAFFSLEVVSVGIMHYSALLPCVLSAYVARGVARYLGVFSPFYDIGKIPGFEGISALKVAGLAFVCAIVSILFCMALRHGEKFAKKILKNRYIRAAVLGTIVLVLTFAVGDQTYNGAGADYISQCVAGHPYPFGFIIKIAFTVLSIIAGYKGGEIVPSFFIGASLGSLYGTLISFEPDMCAAIGMGAVFCGVTNCPVTSLLICIELFGFNASLYFLIAIAIAYTFSGYSGLYTSQKIVYSKFHSNFIDKKTK